MSEKYVVGSIGDFPLGTHKLVELKNRKIGIFNIHGELFALPNMCPHQVGPLCEGKVSGTLSANKQSDWKMVWSNEGEILTCPWHGLEYRVQTGQCLAYPQIKLRSYQIVIEQDLVHILL